MKLPGCCGELSGKCVKLKKALYGLKQSGALWNNLAKNHGMDQCKADPCVFREIANGVVVLVLAVHVGDVAVAGPRDEVDKLLVTLNRDDFTTVDLGELTFFTGQLSKISRMGQLRSTQRRLSRQLPNVSTSLRLPATLQTPVLT